MAKFNSFEYETFWVIKDRRPVAVKACYFPLEGNGKVYVYNPKTDRHTARTIGRGIFHTENEARNKC